MTELPPVVRRRVDTGNAELHADPYSVNGWSLFVNDVAQSYVDLDLPEHLEFDYTRWIASVIDSIGKPGQPLRVLHLGGGAMTLPRYVAATRPGSVQYVVEVDGRLAALVNDVLPLPDNANVDIIIGDATTTLLEWDAGDVDLIVADAFRAATMPESLTGTRATAAAAHALSDGGVHIANIIDTPPYHRWRTYADVLRATFPEVGVIAGHDRKPHPRFDNIIIAAAREPGILSGSRMRDTAENHETRISPAIGDALTAILAATPPEG